MFKFTTSDSVVKVLFIHQNFPGQFRHIAGSLSQDRRFDVLAIAREYAPGLPGVTTLRYKPSRVAQAETHHYVRGYEDAVLHGQAVLRLLMTLKGKGYRPDVILAHPGWGETLFIREVYPDVRLVHLCEYYYHTKGADADFDPEFPLSADAAARIRARNALHLLNLEQCDVGITPTQWQHSLHPQAYRNKITVIHEGVDVECVKPDPSASLILPNGTALHAGDPVITYVARNLEPYRGFHQFMRALPEILKANQSAQVIVIGGDDVSYGTRPSAVSNWRTKLLQENPVDPARVHFLGRVPYDVYLKVLQVSAVHVYLTYPFVLSWSMLEAMACGCLVLGSRTAPVEEVIRHRENGLLVDFFDGAGIVSTVLDVLENPYDFAQLRLAARKLMSDRYRTEAGIEGYRRLLGYERVSAAGAGRLAR